MTSKSIRRNKAIADNHRDYANERPTWKAYAPRRIGASMFLRFSIERLVDADETRPIRFVFREIETSPPYKVPRDAAPTERALKISFVPRNRQRSIQTRTPCAKNQLRYSREFNVENNIEKFTIFPWKPTSRYGRTNATVGSFQTTPRADFECFNRPREPFVFFFVLR